MQTSTVASYNSGYVAPNGPLQRKPLICYTCGKPGHKSVECRSKPPNATLSGNFVKGQWLPKRPDTTSNYKPKLLKSNMIVQSDEDESDSNDHGMVLAAGGGRGHVPNRNFGSQSLHYRKRNRRLDCGYWVRSISCELAILRDDY